MSEEKQKEDEGKVGAVEFSELVFKTIQEAEGLVKAEPDEFPWSKCDRGNHSDAEAQLTEIYAGIGLKPPRFAWALSPPALFTAIQMLRAVHVGQRHKFIEAMVQADDPIASAKRTLLDAITDRNVMTTMGAAVKPMFDKRYKMYSEWRCLKDLAKHLLYYDSPQHKSPLPVKTPARFAENTIYPAMYFMTGWLSLNTLLVLPYVHVVWICEAPLVTEVWPNQHLRMMKFADGYEVRLADPDANKFLEYPVIPSETYEYANKMLESAEAKTGGINVITRRVLFAMCSLGKHEGCSGIITEQMAGRVDTICTCECHEKKGLSDGK